MAAPTAVVFDIDGTLTETTYLHALAWWRAFREAGETIPIRSIHRCIGMGSAQLLETLAGSERGDLKRAWRRQFESLKPEVVAFPGAAQLLRAVAGAGALAVLASSSEEEDLEVLLAAIDAPDAIAWVTSAGDVEEAKPSPDVFEVALQKAGVRPEDALVVGDTVWDVEAARRCGLETVAVLTGGISEAELREAGAVAVYSDVAALLEGLRTSPLARLLR